MSLSSDRPRLLWSIDFAGPSGQKPGEDTWTFELGDGSDYGIPGWGNAEHEIYVDSAAQLDGESNLVIRAERDQQQDQKRPTGETVLSHARGVHARLPSRRGRSGVRGSARS